VAKRLQIKQKATETKSLIFVRNHKTEFLEHTLNDFSDFFNQINQINHCFLMKNQCSSDTSVVKIITCES